ncbi:ankyrin repeat domain-containing protein [Candidatus Cardinium hertigii]|uniref:ankyrin repeat domain-containing protein n=1 Tax=Candidatus Cardinium hertigii TaxID=247481 RepID=UPI003D7D4ECF
MYSKIIFQGRLINESDVEINLKYKEDGSTPLYLAAFHGHIEIVKLLLETPRIQVNLQNKSGCTPLHAAALFNHVEVIKILLSDPRTDVNAKSNLGKTALDIAQQFGHDLSVHIIKHIVD